MSLFRYGAVPMAMVVLMISGCFASATYTHTANKRLKPKSTNCSFKIRSTLPGGTWEEIGVVNVQIAQSQHGMSGPETPAAFRKLIGKSVCTAGGELVVGEINGLGQYVRGTVFIAGKPKSPTGDGATKTTASGCQYDTQCKGDRICEEGRCVTPPADPQKPKEEQDKS